MADDPEAAGPLLRREQGLVDEDRERHVVLDQVLPRVAEIDRVPVRELPSKVLQDLRGHFEGLRDRARVPDPAEHEVEERVVEAPRPRDLRLQVPALEYVGDRVVRHVHG